MAFFAQFGYTNQANAGPSSANYSYYSDTTKPRKNTATNMDVIVADVCNCIHSFENSLSEKVKAQVINATKNGGLDTIWKYFDRRDQDAYFNEGKKTFDCLKRLEKKYPFFTNYNKESIKLFSKSLKQNCSEFAAAIMDVK